ncbi:MAG: hypothetical protein JWM51_950 [Microbacteriaceae bacterium]|jgi:hypothetical protein|nr:hypothetical protein [Microbacteriaceae bacterium]
MEIMATLRTSLFIQPLYCAVMQTTRSITSNAVARFFARSVDATSGSPRARAVLLHPAVARPGYWVATAAGLLWGCTLSRGRLRRAGGVVVASRCPRWAFGRGGTTIGAVFLTHTEPSAAVLEHEAVHREQWRRYGLSFIPLYIAAGAVARTNRFEIEAGLRKGGYE